MLSKSEVKHIQSLAHQKGRKETGCFIAEGVKLVEDLLDTCSGQFVMIYATDEFVKKNYIRLQKTQYRVIDEHYLSKITLLQTPNQVTAILRKFDIVEPVSDADDWILALDGVQNPGNLGTIIRNADWFGVKTIVCSEDTVDCYNPKVVQASMGSIARVSISYQSLASYLPCLNKPICGATLNGCPLSSFKWPGSGILVLGGEGHGIRPELAGLLDHKLTIEGRGAADSLNVGAASAIFLWEMRNLFP
ncbi:MAG: RNA methyltransferase [Bacteroidetes bacterium]|nr:RNA methyltransferase [Bacteroidota bacterium]